MTIVTEETDWLGNETKFSYNKTNRLESIRKAGEAERSKADAAYRRDEQGTV